MQAIIRAGGHQEKVVPGEQITVDRVKQEVGEELTFTPLVITKEDGSVVSDRKQLTDQNAAVVGRVVQHLKGDKVDIFMYRNKTGFRKHTGHRQPLTLVEIAEIRLGGDVARAPEPEPEQAESPAAGGGQAASKPKADGKKAGKAGAKSTKSAKSAGKSAGKGGGKSAKGKGGGKKASAKR